MQDLRYSVIVDSLLAAIPELRPQQDALQMEIGPDVLPFLTVELVLEPFLRGLLSANAPADTMRRVFAFLEEMAQSQNVEVVNLLYVGIFEHWAGEPETLSRAREHLGEGTRRVARDAAHRLNLRGNLPLDGPRR